jgi:mRNA-degrading endonuclease RelE of RelBE toxin-antitoxin system
LTRTIICDIIYTWKEEKRCIKIHVNYSKRARKYLDRLDKPNRKKIKNAIEDLKELKGNIIRVEGTDMYRLKIPPFRIGFEYDEDNGVIEIVLIRPRGDFYNHIKG